MYSICAQKAQNSLKDSKNLSKFLTFTLFLNIFLCLLCASTVYVTPKNEMFEPNRIFSDMLFFILSGRSFWKDIKKLKPLTKQDFATEYK